MLGDQVVERDDQPIERVVVHVADAAWEVDHIRHVDAGGQPGAQHLPEVGGFDDVPLDGDAGRTLCIENLYTVRT